MKSEEIEFKEIITNSYIKELNKNMPKSKNNIKEEKIIKINIIPLIQIRQIPFLSESIINYFAIGICHFVYGCFGLEWFNISEEENKSFYLGYFLIGGICLYIIGIINWYEGKELVYLIDFVLSFLFITLFLKNKNLGNISDYLGTYDNDKIQGIFYILLFCFILVVGISSKDIGIVYIFDNAILFVSYVFLFAYKFFKNKIIGNIDNYMFIVAGGLFWLTGIFKLLNNLLESSIVIFEPTD